MALTYSKGKWVSALSLSLLCVVSMSGCSKKDKEAETTTEAETAVEVQPDTAAATLIPCDDTATVNNLSRSIKDLIAQQARNEMSKYATQVGTSFDMTAVSNTMNEVIVDLGTAKVLDTNANANDMQTCQASLSLTLPSENIYLANEVYNGLEGKSMQQTLAASNVRLSNNMLVDDTFTYVVGMQGGQAVAKVAGQPAIIKAVADIMAKSQLKEMMETNVVHPAAPATPRPPAAPRVKDDTVRQNRQTSNSTRSNSSNRIEEAETVRQPTIPTPVPNNTQDNPAARSGSGNAIPSAPKLSEKLTVPTDESMDMVIIEEDATY